MCSRIAYESVSSPALEVNVIIGERLVHYYGNLYTKARVDTMDALDSLGPLNSASELKNKILFSVIVVRGLALFSSAHLSFTFMFYAHLE